MDEASILSAPSDTLPTLRVPVEEIWDSSVVPPSQKAAFYEGFYGDQSFFLKNAS